ncbi:PTS sugar transporter subunit IIA [Lacrimispora sp. JR3]|uniref:PTS sugar transporter subunit IIA n=1 Tax=Lacrimispora sinapis TaxID=3111456 RepID=UPI0037499368
MDKKKVILVSHGKLSAGMLHSIQMIIGENEDVSSMGMMPGEHYQPMVDALEQKLKENPDTQYVVVADLMGGSVCNGMTTLLQYPNIKLVAGMNMGLVINLVLSPGVLTDEEIDAKVAEANAVNKRIQPELLTNGESGEDDFF